MMKCIIKSYLLINFYTCVLNLINWIALYYENINLKLIKQCPYFFIYMYVCSKCQEHKENIIIFKRCLIEVAFA